MRCLAPVSLILLLLSACGSPYKRLLPAAGAAKGADILKFKPHFPAFQKEVYRCHVDGRFLFKSFHLSGLLLFKNYENGETRVLFSNEMGFTFFDFGWDASDSFKVNSIIEQLNRPALVRTLRKDLELLLLKNIQSSLPLRDKDTLYYQVPLAKGNAYYIADATKLLRIEVAGRKKVATIYSSGYGAVGSMADSISIVHHKANFTIEAKKIINAIAD